MMNAITVFEKASEQFGIRSLYPWQQFVIASIIDCFNDDENIRGETATNRIVLLPTGAGKSLCFQVPSIVLPGITVVVYPLLALMADQEKNLKATGILPAVLRGGMSTKETDSQFAILEQGGKMVIANPEILRVAKIADRLRNYRIAHLVIDEAHCVASWGDSFRPAYLELATVIRNLKPDTVTAFTATASPAVLARMSEVLFNGAVAVMRGDSDRPNLRYRVRYAYALDSALVMEVAAAKRPLVVFCGTRRRTEYAAELLRRSLGWAHIKYYHAGLSRQEKQDVEEWFNDSNCGVLTATCAWGMGVDKKDVRTVIHYDLPSSVEAYVQEAGRAGRDGSIVSAVALVSKFPPDKSPLASFVSGLECRRHALLSALTPTGYYREPEIEACSGCDVCDGLASGYTDAEIALRFIKRNRFRYTVDSVSKLLEQAANVASYNKYHCFAWEPEDMRRIVQRLITEKRIKVIRFPFFKKVTIVF